MSKCTNCERDVHKYKLVKGDVICHACYPDVVIHRLGFKFNGGQCPTQTDHCKNLGLPKPTVETQNWELKAMHDVAKVGGERRVKPRMRPVIGRLAERNGVGRLRGL